MATFTNQTKSSTSFINQTLDLGRVDLKIGDGYFLTIQDLFNLDIEVNRGASLANQSKTSTSFTNQTKN